MNVIYSDIRKIILTFIIAGLSGWLFLLINFPAPFLIGSLLGVWIIGGTIKKIQLHLGVARWFHIPVVLGLGVFTGSFFKGDLINLVITYAPTVIAMITVTVFATLIGYFFLTQIRSYNPITAILCSLPGGQAEAIIMAREMVEKDYIIALFHLTRVAFIFISTPLLLAAIEGQEAVQQSNQLLQTMPTLLDLNFLQFFLFISIAVGGLVLAMLIRLPMPHLLGPLFLSAVFHSTGWVDIPRIFEFVLLAQLSIGGAVGARLAQVKFSELMVYFKDSLINTSIILVLYFLAALLVAYLLGTTVTEVWLAFVPGGIYEVTLLAVIFGFDIAFIAFHHTFRIILIFFTMPVIATKFQNKIGAIK